MSSKKKGSNDIAQDQGSSSWLTVLPIKQLGFSLSKAEFWIQSIYNMGFH